MRLREIFTEAWRNVRAGTSGALMFALAAGLLGGLAGGIDVTTSVAGIRTAYEFRAAGANVQMITLNGLIDGPGCDSLPGADGTVAAGAFRILDDRIRVAALPGSALTQVEVTPGLVEVLTGERSDSGAGLWASQTLAEDLGLDVGDEVRTDRGTTTLAGTFAFPSDGRDRALGYALLSPVLASSGIFDTCLVETWPPRLRGDGWTAPAVRPDPASCPSLAFSTHPLDPSWIFSASERAARRGTWRLLPFLGGSSWEGSPCADVVSRLPPPCTRVSQGRP